MASGKLSPRQKMINMMYLVLTALLALNVSKDILDAFAKVENGFSKTVTALESKNADLYSSFAKIAESKEVAKPLEATAKQIRQKSNVLNDHIETLHKDIFNLNGDPELKEELGIKLPSKMDDLNNVANLLLKEPKRAQKLKVEIEKYRNYLLTLDIVKENPERKADILTTYNTDDVRISGANQKWEDATFGHYPLIAILTFLRKMQADVVKTESDLVSDLFTSVGESEFSFDELEAMIVPKSSSLMSGDKFEADIFVTAFDSRQNPEVEYTTNFSNGEPVFNGDNIVPVEKGKGKLAFTAGGVGERNIGAKVTITKNDGTKESWTTKNKYNVASPTAVVSPTKMNVFYKGVPNPIEVSVPGVDSRSVKISVSGASQRSKGKGTYDVVVADKAKEVNVSVTANGKRIGKPKLFRVKKIPNPLATISGKVEGPISKGLLGRTPGIRASLKDFPFDIKFRVRSYTCRIKEGEYVKPLMVKGDRFTAEIKEKIRKAKSGTDISFTAIKAVSKEYPKIGVKSCSPISLTIN